MSLVDKVANGAKKGFDWFTFADGISQQQSYMYQAIDFDSPKLQREILYETIEKWLQCSGVQTAGYLTALTYFNSPSFEPRYLVMSPLLVGALEFVRWGMRGVYEKEGRDKFDEQIAKCIVIQDPIPPQINPISEDNSDFLHRDSNYWKYDTDY